MKTIIFLVALLAFTGCTTSHMSLRYYPYAGPVRQWPTKAEELKEVVDNFPIYHGFPSKPYTVLGKIETIDNNSHRLVRVGRKYHGDAIVITVVKPGRYDYYYPLSEVPSAGSQPEIRSRFTYRIALLVKFKPPHEARLDEINAFLAKAQANPGGWSVKDARGRTNFITRKQVSERVAELEKEKQTLEAITPKSPDSAKR